MKLPILRATVPDDDAIVRSFGMLEERDLRGESNGLRTLRPPPAVDRIGPDEAGLRFDHKEDSIHMCFECRAVLAE
jgi:hypothetical protein